jgi:Cft2 family RNA processing exonuclease
MSNLDDLFLRNRKILVGARASGKTKNVLEIAHSKLLEGKDVLFVSGYGSRAAKAAFDRMKELIDHDMKHQRSINKNVLLFLKSPVYNHVNLTIDYNGRMKFISLEFYKSISYESYLYDKYFKILDNIDANLDFDVATISGTSEILE